MQCSLLLLATGLGVAALAPVASVAHAASSGYTTLNHTGYTTVYRSTWTAQDMAGRAAFQSRNAARFPTVTVFTPPDGNAGVVLGARQGRDSAAQVRTIERESLLHKTHVGYQTVKGYTQTTQRINAHTYVVASITFASRSDRVSEAAYSTFMGGQTFYVFVVVDSKASAQEARDAVVILSATTAH